MKTNDMLDAAIEKIASGWLEILPAIKHSIKEAAKEAIDELTSDDEFINLFSSKIKEKNNNISDKIEETFLPNVDSNFQQTDIKMRYASVPLSDIVSPGDILTWKDDENVTCMVTQDTRQIVFEDKITSINKAALKVLHRTGRNWTTVNAREFWCLNGKTIVDIVIENRKNG
jgi:hypothetical protein